MINNDDVLNDEKYKLYSKSLENKLQNFNPNKALDLYKEIFINENNKELAYANLALLTFILYKDKLVLEKEILEISIKCKREKKFLPLNFILDILYTIKFIKYEIINKDLIVARVIEKEFLFLIQKIKKEIELNAYNNKDNLMDKINEFKRK